MIILCDNRYQRTTVYKTKNQNSSYIKKTKNIPFTYFTMKTKEKVLQRPKSIHLTICINGTLAKQYSHILQGTIIV